MEALSAFFNENFFNPLKTILTTVLPHSPFQSYLKASNDFNGILKAVNYFVPINAFVAILQVWVTAMFLYYLYHGLISKIWEARDSKSIKEVGAFLLKILKKIF